MHQGRCLAVYCSFYISAYAKAGHEETHEVKRLSHRFPTEGDYYRIPADNRDLNYEKYFSEGDVKIPECEEYHSHNTNQLDVSGMKELLRNLKEISQDLILLK